MTLFSERFTERLKDLGLDNKSEVARIIEVSDVTVGKWCNGEAEPKGKHLIKLAKLLKTRPEWLTGETQAMLPEDYQECDIYYLAGAGNPVSLIEGEPIDTIYIRQEFLNEHMVVVKAKGHSMEPTIMNGAYLGIDIYDKDIISGEMYALWIPYEGAIIKRVHVDPRGTIQIISDNPDSKRYPTVTLQMNELNEHLVQGRVKWVIQKF